MPEVSRTPLVDEMVELSGQEEGSALVRASPLNYVQFDYVSVVDAYVRSYPHLAVRCLHFLRRLVIIHVR